MVGRVANSEVDDEGCEQRRQQVWPERWKDEQKYRGAGQEWVQDVPRAALDCRRPCHPPEIVSVGITQARERQLRAFPRRGIRGHAHDECLERVELVAERCGAQAMIQRMLAQRALSAIERGEHVV